MKCFCNVPGLGRKFCPAHHQRTAPDFSKKLSIRNAQTIVRGNATTPRKIIDTRVHLEWSANELNAMSLEELWTVANMLRLPHMKPETIHINSTQTDLKRHIKAFLGMYSKEALEKYFETYGRIMADIIKSK